MAQQKGAKRAVKVANRKRKQTTRARQAEAKRLARKASQPKEEKSE